MDGPDFGGDHSAFKNRPSGQGQGRQTSRSNRNDPFPLVIQEAQPTPTSTNAYKSKPEIDFYSFSLERVRYIKNETNGKAQFVRHLWMYLGNTIFFILFLVIMMFLPISMIVIGAIYKDDCPRERNIPIYLIVGGVFGFILNCMFGH